MIIKNKNNLKNQTKIEWLIFFRSINNEQTKRHKTHSISSIKKIIYQNKKKAKQY